MERLWSLAGATSGNRWQMREPRKRQKQAKTVATGCHQLPIGAHGKEGGRRFESVRGLGSTKAFLSRHERPWEDSGRSQRLDRRRGDDPFHPARQSRVQGYERFCLQLSECNVLGVVGLGPPQLLGEVPGPTPEHGVA